jgi:hypothetical protein
MQHFGLQLERAALLMKHNPFLWWCCEEINSIFSTLCRTRLNQVIEQRKPAMQVTNMDIKTSEIRFPYIRWNISYSKWEINVKSDALMVTLSSSEYVCDGRQLCRYCGV